MTSSSSNPELAKLRPEVEALIAGYKAGGPEAFSPFLKLVDCLFQMTVAAEGASFHLVSEDYGNAFAKEIAPRGPLGAPLPLRGKRGYLVASIQVFIDRERENRLSVSKSRFQYQLDKGGRLWVFRYEYIRDPDNPHPSAHVHIRGKLTKPGCLPKKEVLKKVHFPTGRVPFEAIIRLLVSHFQIPCAKPKKIWSPLLLLSEAAFHEHSSRLRVNPNQG